MAYYCSNCGSELKDGDKFCGNCGKVITSIQFDSDESVHNVQLKPHIDEYKKEISEDNGLAILGFVLSFFSALIGLIVSIIALKNADDKKNPRKGFAIAGICISVFKFLYYLYWLILLYFGFSGLLSLM